MWKKFLHRGWKIQGFEPGEVSLKEVRGKKTGWLKAEVPGVVWLDLIREGALPDPFYGLNEKKVGWVEGKEWWYRTEFTLEKEKLKKSKKIELVTEGLDTFSTLWLNGRKIGETSNMFIPYSFDLTPFREEKNFLFLRFSPPSKVLKERESKEREGKKRTERLYFDFRVYGRKAQYSFGWDWAPRLPGIGIWKDIYLLGYEKVALREVEVETELFSLSRAKIKIKILIEVFSRWKGSVEIFLGEERKQKELALLPGKHPLEVNFELKNPLLWFPRGYGSPYLYPLTLRLKEKRKILEERFLRVGIRKVELVQEKDGEGKSFYFKINEIPVFCKGANWIPLDSFLPRVKEKTYQKFLQKVVRAEMNMLRVWGGGIYEDETFYRICDEKGIMVWQDFMFACGEYPEETWFWEEVEEEAISVIKRLKNHPSVVLWCGNNENEAFRWGAWRVKHERFYGETIYYYLLPYLLRKLDPSRPYLPSSPWGEEEYNSQQSGDRHSWEVWGEWKTIEAYLKDKGRFFSEFGFQAPPVKRTLESFLPPQELKNNSEIMRWHNKDPQGPEKLERYLLSYSPPPKNLDQWIFYTQLNQAEALRVMIEHARRRKFACGGVLLWQFNDCWPAISWSIIDYYGREKPAYWQVKRSFQPLIVSGLLQGERIEIWLSSDELREREGILKVQALSLEGKLLGEERKRVSLPPNSSLKVLEILPEDLGITHPQKEFIYLRFEGKGFLCENTLFFRSLKDLCLPPRRIKKWIDKRKGRVSLSSPFFVKGVALEAEGGEFSDNWFDLLPGVEKEVELVSSGKGMEGLKKSLKSLKIK